MRVFVSHSSQDKPAVEALAEALRARGIEPWLDKWEIGLSGDFIAKINEGLDEADAGIIVFSKASADSPWVKAEASYLTWARIKEGKLLIPVELGDAPFIPALLRPLIRHPIGNVGAIVDALHNRKPGPVTPIGPGPARVAVLVSLTRVAGGAVEATLEIDGVRYPPAPAAVLPAALLELQSAFLRGPRYGALRDVQGAARAAHEAVLAELGRHLGALCFPGDAGAALAALVDGCPVGTMVETVFAADDPGLLGLPFEAARLPDDRVLALLASVVTLRRPLTKPPFEPPPPRAGPLKILLAVAAPDAAAGGGPLLDYERESQNILDAVRDARRLENCEVRVLELGHPQPIADAFRADAYHVLHLSCHGGPGVLELEDEDGAPCRTTAQALLEPVRETGKPLPLVLLNACHGGVPADQTASFAQALLAGGVPAVLAMQAPVSDAYAIALADAFYRALAEGELLRPSVALAQARRQMERDRLDAIARGAPAAETQPEYATAALFVAGGEQPLADFHQDKAPLRASPVHTLTGPVPQLTLGELIGRRRELREALGVLRDPAPDCAGVVLTGIGGVGKSALAGRIMCRLAEQDWLVPAIRGKFSLTAIATAIGTELIVHDPSSKLAQALLNQNLPDQARAQLLTRALAEHPVLLVLDDFEQNLTVGGDSFLDPDTAEALLPLAGLARTGRLLLTCRYPLPGVEAVFHRIAVPPLSPAETRKKLLRLGALAAQPVEAAAKALRLTGGHPRVLEFLDALLRAKPERAGLVVAKLEMVARAAGLDVNRPALGLDAAARAALALGERDVLLPELLNLVRREGIEPALLQAAVSNLPVSPAGLARMLDDDGPGDAAAAGAALDRLAALTLLHRDEHGAGLVHRWTAEGLRRCGDAAVSRARCERAAAYRLWRFRNEPDRSFDDLVEALRNYLAGEAFDEAAGLAQALLGALSQAAQAVMVAALAAEVLEALPEHHQGHATIADAEAQAHLALGFSDRAFRRYRMLLHRYEVLARNNPDRADYQRDLSICYIKMGDLHGALGQGETARKVFARALWIAERLAAAEPDRADYQRDLSVCYIKMGDQFRALGQGEAARQPFAQALAIAERLGAAEPDRADYQHDLSVSYNKMGNLYRELGQGEAAREFYLKDLAIAARMAATEPDRADYQRDLSISYNQMGDLYRALGQNEAARQALAQALAIRERLATAEPDRADYQRDLSVSYNQIGDLYRALGQDEAARDFYLKDLAIAERLAAAEPDRADYQRDLSVSYNRMGDLYRALGQDEAARQVLAQGRAITEHLAAAEPDRADYQRDLVVSLVRAAKMTRGHTVREHLQRALGIVETLQAEGRLAPADAGMLPALRQMLDELPS
jgi:tetratricopeptide (TPR) repeat protein